MDLYNPLIQDEGNEYGPHNPPAIETPEIPQLALGMQTMQIAEQAEDSASQKEESKFNLFMKIACSGGNPRAISLNIVQQAMSKAWRNNYYKISQVNKSIFRAQFQTFEAMMAVFTRQPWVVGSDNLLLELENPEEKDPTSDFYNFDSIYVTVRAYGIPQKNRSLQLLKNILEKVGVQSEFHELKDFMLTSKPDYIWGVARMKVGVPVLDRIRLNYSNTEAGIAYLHFEKIERICLFCGIMFHTTATCHLRQQIITARICKRQNVDDVPFQRFGQWIIDYEKMPKNFAVQGEGSNPIFSTFQHPELSKLHKYIESDQQRKGKLAVTNAQSQILSTQDQRFVREQNLALTVSVPTTMQKQNHVSEALTAEIQQKVTQDALQKTQFRDIEMLPDGMTEECASIQNQQRQGIIQATQLIPVVQTNKAAIQQSGINLVTRTPISSSFDSRLHTHMQQ